MAHKKLISNNNIKGQLTVNVLTHLTKENTFVESVLNHTKVHGHWTSSLLNADSIRTKTFTRHFKRNFNMTPKQWMLSIKKNEMINSLKNTRHSLKQIASDLGFSNVSHLSDFCLKKTGMRPEEIRNNP